MLVRTMHASQTMAFSPQLQPRADNTDPGQLEEAQYGVVVLETDLVGRGACLQSTLAEEELIFFSLPVLFPCPCGRVIASVSRVKFKKVQGLTKLLGLFRQPNIDCNRTGEDVSHDGDLFCPFHIIILVHAYFIDPEISGLIAS